MNCERIIISHFLIKSPFFRRNFRDKKVLSCQQFFFAEIGLQKSVKTNFCISSSRAGHRTSYFDGLKASFLLIIAKKAIITSDASKLDKLHLIFFRGFEGKSLIWGLNFELQNYPKLNELGPFKNGLPSNQTFGPLL